VIVDAAFLDSAQRRRFAELARNAGASFVIASCSAPSATLLARVAEREREAKDASEAGLAVLEQQLARAEPLMEDEAKQALLIDAARTPAAFDAAVLARRLGLNLE
ncbi:MAG: ATP-binding protein, partial [Pseudomonadota bacterium]